MPKILFVPAHPSSRARDELARDATEIGRLLRATQFGSHLEVLSAAPIDPLDLGRAVSHHAPDVLHLRGDPWAPGQVILQGSDGRGARVTGDALARSVAPAGPALRCVVLDGCYSPALAAELLREVGAVLGVDHRMDRAEVTAFAGAFYGALGFGLAVGPAFELARNRTRGGAHALVLARAEEHGPQAAPAAAQPEASIVAGPPSDPDKTPVTHGPPRSLRGGGQPPQRSRPGGGAEPKAPRYVVMRPTPDAARLVQDATPRGVSLARTVELPSPWREVAVVPFAIAIRQPLGPGTVLGGARRAQPTHGRGPSATFPMYPWVDLGPVPAVRDGGVLWEFRGSRGFEGGFGIGFDGSFALRERVRESTHPDAGRGGGVGMLECLETLAGALLFTRRLAEQFPELGRAWVSLRLSGADGRPLLIDPGAAPPRRVQIPEALRVGPFLNLGGHFDPRLEPDELVDFVAALGAELSVGFGLAWDPDLVGDELGARIAAAES